MRRELTDVEIDSMTPDELFEEVLNLEDHFKLVERRAKQIAEAVEQDAGKGT